MLNCVFLKFSYILLHFWYIFCFASFPQWHNACKKFGKKNILNFFLSMVQQQNNLIAQGYFPLPYQ